MDPFSKMSVEELGRWLNEQGVLSDVVTRFEENDVDGDALMTLVGLTPGPDCLKELIPKIGTRMKVYKLIKAYYDESFVCYQKQNGTSDTCSGSEVSSIKESGKENSPCCSSDKESFIFVPSKSVNIDKKKNIIHKKVPDVHGQSLPNPFIIPTFRKTTEHNLSRHILTESDRKYMVQTLATLLMTHIQKPAMKHCLVVSQALHRKFTFLGSDESSENSWKWFIYYRTQNTNKPSHSEPAMKVAKTDVKMRHYYPDIPHCEDETSNQRNLELLKEENTKPKPSQEVMKALMGRTFSKRRSDILNLKYPNSLAILAEFPALKRSTYAKQEFDLIIQRENIKEEFDEGIVSWSKAVIVYCKRSCTKSTAIQSVIKDTDLNCDENLLIKAVRCLGLLLIHNKTKNAEGDIPFLIKFVPIGTPASEAPQPDNNQPHIVAFDHDEYMQYFIALEQSLIMECRDIVTALFLLLAAHYIFNLSYHAKVNELMRFLQEKIAGIQSDEAAKKIKSPVATSHIQRISSVYDSMKDKDDDDDDTVLCSDNDE